MTLRATDELTLILDILRESPVPLAVGEIATRLEQTHGIARGPRQVAYLLQQAARGVVARSGSRRGTKYALAAAPRPVGTDIAPAGRAAPASRPVRVSEDAKSFNAAVPFLPSAEGQELLALIRRPLHERRPVGYDRDWLFSYVPNTTFYLPESTRAQLHRIGTPAGTERPAGTFARAIFNYLLIDLAWASSRLEGNTYSLLDTQNLIEFGQRAEHGDAEEAQMILNHKSAIELLVSGSLGPSVSGFAIRSLHAALSSGLLPDARAEGRLRDSLVGISQSSYQPTGIPQVIEECFARIAESAAAISDPYEASFFLLVHLPYLQPFRDVNKRTSRLAANIPLVVANRSPLSFVGTPTDAYAEGLLAVYETRRIALLRDVFVYAYERSCERYVVVEQAVPRPDPLRLRYRDELDAAIAATVRGGAAPSRRMLLQWAGEQGIPGADQAAFAEKALEMLLALNDASAMRAGIRPAEFFAWRERFTA